MNSQTQTADRAVVRDLAKRIAALAHEPRMEAICRRWRDVNALRKPDRAPVYCRPVGCWKEILPATALSCRDPWLRGMEYGFRQTLHKRDIDDDTPVEPYFAVGARFDVDPPNTWGVDIGRHRSSEEGGAWAYDPPLKTEAVFERLRRPSYTYNDARTREALDRADALLGDILPVKLTAGAPLHAVIGNPAADLRGLEQMMMDMIAEPHLMHRLMAHIRDAVLGAMDAVAATGLITPNNVGAMTCSDPIGAPPAGAPYGYEHCWCMTNSQEFDQVSPAMWEAFCLHYQRPILERFGLVGYGCCENLTHKIDGVLSIPNLRIFVCSAWTDLQRVLEKCGDRYCIMWRQKASAVVFPDDDETIREELNDGARLLRGHHYQIVLRELQTLAGHPDRLHVWARLAKEAAERYA